MPSDIPTFTIDSPETPPRRALWKPLLASGCLGVVLGAAGMIGSLLGAYAFFYEGAMKKIVESKEMKPVQLRADYAWEVLDMDGGSLDLRSLKGKPIFLHIWRPECASCLAEVPGVNALYAALAPKGVAFVSVALDATDNDLDVAQGVREVQYPIYTLPEGGYLPEVFNTISTPTTYIIDPSGFIVYAHSGAVNWDSPDGRDFLERLCAD